MQHTSTTVQFHHPSRSTLYNSQIGTWTRALADKLCQSKERHVRSAEAILTYRSAYRTHIPNAETNSTCWPSTRSTMTSVPASILPFWDGHSHGSGHSSIAETIPPPLHHRDCVPLPSQSDSENEVVLHPLLLCPRRVGVYWDLAEWRGRIERVMRERWYPMRDLATHPTLPSMTLVHPWLPWPIIVHASGMDSRGITIADVLLTISTNLMAPIDETGRMNRASYLRGRWMFVGLQTSDIGGDVWELVVL
ncbi:hypothetical protein L218DRAFT_967751 [Marasmius fiardii PR-910]|nr:hypothetical protein L218DRAFT_967751 [Marasmius fiardii PR-910]